MSILRHALFALFTLLSFSPPLSTLALAAEAEAPAAPWTKEKVKPPEVQDKEKNKEDPIATCEKRDKKTGEKYHEAVYRDGTSVRYYPLPPGSWLESWPPLLTGWVIIIPGPKGKTKITYSFVWYGEKQRRQWVRTVEEPGKNPVTEDWKEANEPEKGSWLSPSHSTSLANVAFPGYSAADPISSNFSPPPLLLAATAERPQSQTPQTQEKPTLNLKPVTYGAPLPDPVIHLDPGPPTKPEDFVQNPSPSGWNPPTDAPGPTTVTPGPQGTPVTPIPGGGISVGSGWASATVPGPFLADCGGDEDDSDTTTRERTSTEGGTMTQTKTDSKGEPKPTITEQVPTTQAKIDTKTEPKGTATAPPPQASPDQPTGVCGPDITQQVLAVLKEMRDKYNAADDSKKSSACDALVSMSTGEFAWDISEFFVDHGEYPSDKNPQGKPSFLEQLTNGKCCQPRYPCGPTVEFFGKCHNMQVVNYVMWGMTKHLCSGWVNLQQNIAHWARNVRSPNKPEQDSMVDVGENYGKLLESKDKTDPAEFPTLKELIEAHEATSSRAEKICATTCMQKLSPTENKGVEDKNLHWHWTGLTDAVPRSSTGGR